LHGIPGIDFIGITGAGAIIKKFADEVATVGGGVDGDVSGAGGEVAF
jgi:hypothetical protein